MFEIDKKKFGAFISELRKEKGYTQKELAEKLFISDKAISKWETGVSIPDTALLIPLAELLDVTVTELLLSERVGKESSMDSGHVEKAVKTALTYSGRDTERAFRTKTLWPVIYIAAALSGIAGTVLNYRFNFPCYNLMTSTVLCLIFGAYFCFFVKTKLSAYYDENHCGLYYDGPFRMNMPGVVFNNSNWPYIVRVGRIWSCAFLAFYPAVNIAMSLAFPKIWPFIELYVFLFLLLGGLFIPMYIVGKKYE